MLKMSAGRPVSLKPPTTTGSPDKAAWRFMILKDKGSQGRELASQTDVCRSEPWEPGAERCYQKSFKTSFKRELVTHLIMTFGLSIRQACRRLNLSRTEHHYHPDTMRDEPVLLALQAVAERYLDTVFQKFSKFAAAGIPMESQKNLSYLLSAEAEFSP